MSQRRWSKRRSTIQTQLDRDRRAEEDLERSIYSRVDEGTHRRARDRALQSLEASVRLVGAAVIEVSADRSVGKVMRMGLDQLLTHTANVTENMRNAIRERMEESECGK